MHRSVAIAWLVVAAAGLLAGGCRGVGCGGEAPGAGSNHAGEGDQAVSEEEGVGESGSEGSAVFGEEVVLPETRASEVFGGERYVRFGRERVRFGSTVEFTVDQLGSDDPPDVSPIEGMAAERGDGAGRSGRGVFVGVDWTVPTGRLLEFRELLRGTEGLKLKLLGRRVEDWNRPADDTESTAYETGIEVADWRRGRELPGGFLSVEVSSVGFEVHVDKREAEPPLDGCPEGGPTVCLRDDNVEVGEAFLEARRLREEARLEEADQKMREGLGAYDWGRLAGKLAEEQVRREREDVLLIHTAPKLPVALPVRVAAMVRTWRCTESMRERLEEVRAEVVGGGVEVCREGEPGARFFEHRVLVPFDAFWKERRR
jgi:hypothetical protein